AFASARERPFARWLQALGVPAAQASGAADWPTLEARGADDWQAQEGVGAGRANQLVAFFDCAEVREQAARLHATGVPGF
ncbi:MAG: DNA ligase B, partial [Rhodanobacter sp.]